MTLAELNKVYRCQGCGNVYEYLEEVDQASERAALGTKTLAGICPACGSLVHEEENYNQSEQ